LALSRFAAPARRQRFVMLTRADRRVHAVEASPSLVRVRARMIRLASEPLIHFALLGVLVFAGHRALTPKAPTHTLEISDAKQRELAQLFEQRQHRPPTDVERKQVVDRYVEDEVLFREGLRLSLVQTDPMLRAQLIARVRGMLQAEVNAQPPAEEQLRAYYDAHRADYTIAETVSYREYAFPIGPEANDNARQLALALSRGEEPAGPALRLLSMHSRRSEAELAQLEGQDLARRIWTLPVGVWRELSSASGVHVIVVDEHSSAADPPYEAVRPQLLGEYRKEQTAAAFHAEVGRLTSQWRVSLMEAR
jgi:hypothetical protein